MSLAFTDYYEALNDIGRLKENPGFNIKGKRVLDIGAGRGLHTNILRREAADVYSFEPDGDYIFRQEFVKGKTFFDYIENMPKELLGSFDFALQYRYMAQPSTIETAARALKKNGVYIGTFHEGQIGHFEDEESPNFEPSKSDEGLVLRESFKKIKYINLGHYLGSKVQCIASEPLLKP